MRTPWITLMTLLIACAAQSIHPDETKEELSTRDLGPFNTIDEVEEALCPLIMKMPGAQNGPAGTEYCGFIYHAPDGW
jgi:hypothetical protein